MLLSLLQGNLRRHEGTAPPSAVVLAESFALVPTQPWLIDAHRHQIREKDRATIDSLLALVSAHQLEPDEATALARSWGVRL